MAEFTKKGHRLEVTKGAKGAPIFRCRSRAMYSVGETWQKSDQHILSEILVWAPCTAGQMIATLRAWLSVYGDDELLAQAETLVQEAFDRMAPITTPTSSTPPQGGQGMN
jgi:hypothetical protein